MKRTIRILFSLWLVTTITVNVTHAQNSGALTNSTIIKMVKANLADDLIIDEINNARVSFNLSADSLTALQRVNVSARVIQAMKNASPAPVQENKAPAPEAPAMQTTTAKRIEENPKPETPIKAMEKANAVVNNPVVPDKTNINAEAVGYVIPLKELLGFYSDEFNSFAKSTESWDQKIRASLDEGNKKMQTIRNSEKELFDKINADSRGFTEEINKLKENLNQHRESYIEFEDQMVEDGLKMIKELETAGKELNRSISSKFSEVSQAVKKSDADLPLKGIPEPVIPPDLRISEPGSMYVTPCTEVLFFCTNEISDIQTIIRSWNEKVISVSQEDLKLQKQLDPLNKELANLQLDQKNNRKRISELKDQLSDLEKERKRLSQKIKKDSSELAKYLDERSKEVQGSLEERFIDIIENIRYLYQDSFTYRSI